MFDGQSPKSLSRESNGRSEPKVGSPDPKFIRSFRFEENLTGAPRVAKHSSAAQRMFPGPPFAELEK